MSVIEGVVLGPSTLELEGEPLVGPVRDTGCDQGPVFVLDEAAIDLRLRRVSASRLRLEKMQEETGTDVVSDVQFRLEYIVLII